MEFVKKLQNIKYGFFIIYPLYEVPLRQKKLQKNRDTVKTRNEIEE